MNVGVTSDLRTRNLPNKESCDSLSQLAGLPVTSVNRVKLHHTKHNLSFLHNALDEVSHPLVAWQKLLPGSIPCEVRTLHEELF